MSRGRRRKRSKNKKIFLIIGIVLVIILIFGIVVYFIHRNNLIERENNKMQVVLVDDLKLEINSNVKLLSLIDKVNNGSVITEDSVIDTSKIGKKEIVLSIKNIYDEIEEYKFNVEIVDTEMPVIEVKNKNREVYVGKDINLFDGVSVSDNSLEEIKVNIEGEYNVDKEGEYKLKYVSVDSSGNKCEYDFILSVVSDPNNRTFTTSKGFSGKVVNGVTYIDGILIANKSYSLPSSYGSGLTSTTQNAFNKMKSDASELELNIYISSGYRSYYDQKYIYNNYVKNDGRENADTYSARAGHSEHQTGLAFDLNSIDISFANTDEGKWVVDNCYKYGFIIRYPYGKDDITGYMYEPWHLRYVGEELAKKLYNDGEWITLEEYYGIDSKYK